MREHYEELWRLLPGELVLPDFDRRLAFLLSDVRPGQRVLDLGCGNGDFTAALARAGAEAVGVEVAQAAISRASSKHPELDFRLAAIDGPLPFPERCFDLVWASEVIEHVADTARWLSEVRRVLVPGGALLLSTPAHGRLGVMLHGLEHYSQPLGDHLHLYSRGSLRAVLEELGFEQVRLQAFGGAPLLRRTLLARARR